MSKDGTKTFNGVDTSSESRKPGYLKRAINRSFRDSSNKTRPPFIEYNCSFYNSEDEYVFRNGAITGMQYFRGIKNKTNPFLVVAVNDRILAGIISSNSVVFYPSIFKGINPDIQSSFFCKAEDILVFQNGKDYPLYWRGGFRAGVGLDQMRAVYESNFVGSSPMYIGNIMTYCHGRIFVATEYDLIYASDHIYSQGISLDSNEAVLRFSESQYPSSGDGFGATSDMDQITGLAAVRRSGTINGHGEVFAFCRNGAFSIDPTPFRPDWTSQSIQKTLFVGRGCSSPHSILNIGEDIFYRDSDGHISSLKFSAYQNTAEYESDSLSQEVDKYLSYDDGPLLSHSKSIFTDGRALFSCAIDIEKSILGGSHIFSNGLVSMDFSRNENKMKFDGMWTGPRVTQCCSVFSGGVKSSVFASYDTDKKNRLYFLSKKPGDDYTNGIKKKIVSMYSQNMLFYSTDINSTQTTKLVKHDVGYKEALGEITVGSFSSRDGSLCQEVLLGETKRGSDDCLIFKKEKNGCAIQTKAKDFGIITSETPCSHEDGRFFDVSTVITGSVTIISDTITGQEESRDTKFSNKKCEQDIQCCSIEDQNFINQF